MPFDKPPRVTRELIRRALRGEPGVSRWLAQHIVTVVDQHIRKFLRRSTACRDRGVVEELVHDVAMSLYDHDGKLLLAWDERRGASFEYYVGVISRHLVQRRITQFKGNPTALTPVEDIQAFLPEAAHEAELTYVLALDQVLTFVERELGEPDQARFEALYVEAMSVDALAEREGISSNAVHAWTSRLRKRLRSELPQVMDLLEDLRATHSRAKHSSQD